MRLCSPHPLTISISSKDLQESLNSDYDQFEKYLLWNSLIMPMRSSIAYTPKGISYVFSQQQTITKQIYKITMDTLLERQIKIQKCIPQQSIIYRVMERQTQIEIFVGDIIKIGSFEMIIKEICLNTVKNDKQNFKYHSIITPKSDQSHLDSNCQDKCRICFDTEHNKDDPLMSLCKCSGSVKYTHYSCLQQWYLKFMEKQSSQNCDYYHFSIGICDLCKEELPLTFLVNNQKKNLSLINSNNYPYVLIQIASTNDIEIIVLKMNKTNKISIGTSQEADLCFIDQKIDEIHSQICLSNDKLYIIDKSTLFGTLLKLRKNNYFSGTQGIKLQYQNLNMNITKQKNWCSWLFPQEEYNLLFEDYRI